MAWNSYTYKGRYLFNWQPDFTNPLVQGFDHPYDLLEFLGLGRGESIYDEARFGLQAQFLGWDRQRAKDIRDFFDYCKGRLRGFWFPSWQDDVVVTAAFTAD